MQDWTIGDYLDRLAARHPTPASSAVAALNLAQASALLAMVARIRDVPGVVARTDELRDAALELAEADARARGKRHPQAVRVLGRAWLRVIWACWHTNTPTTRPDTAPNNASPPPDLTQETQALPRPRSLRRPPSPTTT